MVRVFEMLVERLGVLEEHVTDLRADRVHTDNMAPKGSVLSGQLHGVPGTKVIKHYDDTPPSLVVQWEDDAVHVLWCPTPEWATGPCDQPPDPTERGRAFDAHMRAALGELRYAQLHAAYRAFFAGGGTEEDVWNAGTHGLSLPDEWYEGLKTPAGPLTRSTNMISYANHVVVCASCPGVRTFGTDLTDTPLFVTKCQGPTCTLRDALTTFRAVAKLLELRPSVTASVHVYRAPWGGVEDTLYHAMLLGKREGVKEKWARLAQHARNNMMRIWNANDKNEHSVWQCSGLDASM